MKDRKIIDELIKLIEAATNLRGSPRGYGTSHPYPKKKIKPPYGKSNYPVEDQVEPDQPKKNIKVSKHLQEEEEGDE